MDEYKVPKQRASVTVHLPPRPPEDATVFLSAVTSPHGGPESVHELLTRDEPFLPMVLASRGFSLVRKGAIRWLRVEDAAQIEGRYFELGAAAPSSRIRCHFPDGETLEGTIRALTPPGEQRVLDVVNLSDGFLHVESPSGLYLANLAHLVTIEVLEEHRGHA